MQLSELISRLLAHAERLNPEHFEEFDDTLLSDFPVDPEVRLAEQPNYPMQHRVSHTKLFRTNAEEIGEVEAALQLELTESERDEAQDELNRLNDENKPIIYIVEGSHLDYASKDLWDQADTD